jgi:hypothetical protein
LIVVSWFIRNFLFGFKFSNRTIWIFEKYDNWDVKMPTIQFSNMCKILSIRFPSIKGHGNQQLI